VISAGATKGKVPDDSPLCNEFCDKRWIPSFINNDVARSILFLNKPNFIFA
jgi:hypothetical protein